MVLLTEKCRRRTVLPHCTVFPSTWKRRRWWGKRALHSKPHTHTHTHTPTTYKYPLTRRRRERKRDRQREAKEETAVAGGDIQRRACTRREKERDRMREYSAQPTRSRFSASSDGRTGNPFRRLPYRPPIPTTGSAVYSESPSTHPTAHPTRDSPLDLDANGDAARTAEHDRWRDDDDDDERRRSFVVKRYWSAWGFKRLLYEYTRGGGINGVAPLSCRRRRCVFARRIISVVVVTRSGCTVHRARPTGR